MVPALSIAKTGLDGQQVKVAVITNNLANVNTTGFKRAHAVFEDLLYQNVRQPGGQTTQDTELPSGLMLGTGVRVVATQKNFAGGNIVHTQNPLDVTIDGRGFFQVSQPDGTIAYSRDGQFQTDSSGRLVTSNGFVIEPAINIPEQATGITIGIDGTVSAVEPGNTSPTNLGQIQVADFINPAGLQPLGQNLFRETQASGAPTVANPSENGLGSLVQGALESSNVNVVEELVGLIETQRAYEMNSKAISTVDGMLQFASQQL